MKLKTLVTVVGGAALLVLVLGMVVIRNEQGAGPAPLSESERVYLARMHSPTLGKAEAPVVIVEFLDPACETCRDFYPFVKEIMAANPDRIRLVLRYAPFHRGSEDVVAFLEAARRQGKFWPALEALLGAQREWVFNHTAQPGAAWRVLERAGLDMERLRREAASPEVAAAVRQDTQDAITLNVTKTPEFFVNGRPMPRFGYDELKGLVDQALASTAR